MDQNYIYDGKLVDGLLDAWRLCLRGGYQQTYELCEELLELKIVIDLSLGLGIRSKEDFELGMEHYLFEILKTEVVVAAFGGHLKGQS